MGRQTEEIDVLNRRTTLTYDLAGQRTQKADARGYEISYQFDSIFNKKCAGKCRMY